MYICEINQLLQTPIGSQEREDNMALCVLWSQLMGAYLFFSQPSFLCGHIFKGCDLFAMVSVSLTFTQLFNPVDLYLQRVCVMVWNRWIQKESLII